ncbi:hypothetical protein CARUB_v10012906mg [Capsella rubella]|uniref:Leucine-rich repeat-containing N-terminal plant-type domain-containing protein n=2 Tax=Capsella rubella TaxID=81985 RepID=R0G2X9_9BRAS|nr:receptor like protein 30 isoform X1 [Capsella rubella]EOA29812.1 hypothetical protein CARUB_v10012906mg [Capsella rubella]
MKDSRNLTIFTIPSTLSFLLYFLFNVSEVFAAPTKHLCRSDQRDAILEFKNEFQSMDQVSYFDSYPPKTDSWEKDSDCCYWDGITCDEKSGDIIEVDLSFSSLSGQLSSKSSLFRLQHLHFVTKINLSNNDFVGPIPSSLGNFSSLTTLDVSRNHFSGKIPSWIGNLSHLTSLDFSHNSLVGEIPSSLAYLSNLTSINLSYNDFDGKLPSSIENLSSLAIFRLSRNNFFGELPPSIGNLLHLTNLSLDRNNFSGKISSSLGNLSHLTSIDFHNNNFDGEIPFSFGNLSHLTSLVLSVNNFVGAIPSSLGSLNKLSILNVKSNKLSGSLPDALVNMKKLSKLSLSNNQLIGTIPSSFFTIPSLDTITLDNNQLNGTLEFGNISSSSKLIVLRLGNNHFIGPISKSLSKLARLKELDLSNLNTQVSVDFSFLLHLKSLRKLYLPNLNTTSTINLNVILSKLKSLETLDLSGNHVLVTNKSSDSYGPWLSEIYLSGCSITEFPKILRTQDQMTTLDVSNNKIKGQVPGWLWSLANLQYVNLSNNTFIGFGRSTNLGLSSVPESYMKQLFGSNNSFTGKIPSFICELSYLTTLDLANNKLSGSIPHCMGNIQVLNLRHNRLSGVIPEDVFDSLILLDVGHNQLEGKLPRSLVRVSFLEVLNVESNRINDTFPSWLSSLQELHILVLRSNAFHGPIQQIKFATLRIIDISDNQFNGTLPPSFFVNLLAMFSLAKNEDQSTRETTLMSHKNYMSTDHYYFYSMVLMNKGIEMQLERVLNIFTAIDFSRNKFEGEIPRSIGLLKELYVLNLSNNAFSGHIPSSMANMIKLESLDVSQNNISGEIPQELGNLSNLARMNFSHNRLVGLVPGGTQFLTQNCSSFEDNLGLFGPSLEKVCLEKTSQESKMTEPKEEEEVINWKAAAIGSIPGIVFGLTMGYILVSYKPEWLMNPFGQNKSKSISSTH